MKYAAKIAAIIVIVGTLAACSGAPKDLQLAEQCESGLIVAYDELNFAEAKGFGGTVDWTKAAGLLTGASFQKEFGKYPNCVDKVRRARYYIEHSQK